MIKISLHPIEREKSDEVFDQVALFLSQKQWAGSLNGCIVIRVDSEYVMVFNPHPHPVKLLDDVPGIIPNVVAAGQEFLVFWNGYLVGLKGIREAAEFHKGGEGQPSITAFQSRWSKYVEEVNTGKREYSPQYAGKILRIVGNAVS